MWTVRTRNLILIQQFDNELKIDDEYFYAKEKKLLEMKSAKELDAIKSMKNHHV